ncbi:MAG TPA: GntR family transcriptional regulator [Amaricoccus sp.]|uniref:GntR family transcriptional regulator n=1 Tax=Amaricoccus sp. TaxID=1872485 RepID=UPI002CC7DFE7|nr:GntR family transcriptional regulator [Amaricoccus sp.]HMQ95009.1 GntR family transcriptional regulator [Amaricoccus sp.]HMR37814.1 GntR family transcriptional regulator [Paracoccus sp. (in: a-proteobacteria)]HMR54812.1 GntR family transcriptional regulator [Amaricoccus sp.]HMU01854.1 GntR family transcriptional regulator [Amaricoccus sp.]
MTALDASPTDLDAVVKPASKPTIAGRIEARLRHDILHGILKPGARLNLDRLRETMDVGLSPLREAVTRLVADGLIEVAAQRGYTVTPISVGNLNEVSALRIELEPYALRRSIANGGLDWEISVMAALYRLNKTDRIAGDGASLAKWEAANNAFHLALIERCDMPLLMKMYRTLVALNDRYRHIYLQAVGIQREVIDEHTAIAEAAVERRVDDAANLLCGHIERSTTNLQRLVAAGLPKEPE